MALHLVTLDPGRRISTPMSATTSWKACRCPPSCTAPPRPSPPPITRNAASTSAAGTAPTPRPWPAACRGGGMSDGFLSRWSRRKRGLEQEPPEAAPAPAPAVPEAAPPAEPEFDPATLPPLESLDSGGDLTAFLHPKVPALLRQAALRRAWTADPGIRDFVGPADYAWDYNAPDGVPGFSFDLGDVDVKKLLAQFTGQPQEPEEAAAGEAPEEAPAALPEEEPAPQPCWPRRRRCRKARCG
ncbi:DUF3306 domain-containing protein [Pseudoroseomonas wenyumeiae]